MQHINVCVCVRVCVCVCVWASIARWLGNRPSNSKVVGSIPSCGHSGNVGVFLSKKLNSHCSSPPSCNINGYLVITGEANVKLLSMSTNGCGPGGTLGAHTITSPWTWFSLTCGALALLQVDLPALAHSAWFVPRHPVPHWVGVTAMRQLETLLCVCVCVCVCACVCVCVYAIIKYSAWTNTCIVTMYSLYYIKWCL